MTETDETNAWWNYLIRIPFTVEMLTALIVVGLLVNSPTETIPHAHRHTFGSSLQTLLDGEVFRLFTSLFLTAGGWRFFASVFMLGFSVGWLEWTHGTWRTIAVFFSAHLLTLAAIYFLGILPLSSLGIEFADQLSDARDVGPSAGYYGCLGFAIGSLRTRWKWLFGLSVLAMLVCRLAVPLFFSTDPVSTQPHLLIGDIAHLIAFPLALVVAAVWRRSS